MTSWKETKMKKLATIAGVIISAAALTACSVVNTQPNEQALRYSDPMAGAKVYKEHYGPSSYSMHTVFNDKFVYPAGQRTYAFQEEGGDAAPISPTTKDGVTVQVAGTVRFQLTSDEKKLQEFHERIGLQLKVYSEEGWREFLRIYLNAPIQRALNDATQGINWMDLYTKPEVKSEWEKDVANRLPAYVEQTIGGDYVENFTVTLQKPVLPEDLESALKDAEVAAQQSRAQEKRNEQVGTELESIRELVDVLGPEGYNVYQAIKDGRISIMPVPQGTDVVVGQPKE